MRPENSPIWLERLVASMLPPSKREQVLGDLAERHAVSRPSTTQYLRDLLQLVPTVLWHQLWRAHRAQPITAGQLAPPADQLRRRVEEFQDSIWRRHLIFGLGLALLLIDSPLIIKTFGFASVILCPILSLPGRWWKQDRGRVVPRNLTMKGLLKIHRETLTHQLDDIGLIFSLFLLFLPLFHLWCLLKRVDPGPLVLLHITRSTWTWMLTWLAVGLVSSVWVAILRNRLLSEIGALDAITSQSSE